MAPGITLQREGSRVYVAGNTYPVKDAIKAAGGHWDGDRKQWWVGAAKQPDLEKSLATVKPPTPGKCRKCGKDCDPKYETCYGCKPAPAQCRQCGARPGPRGWPRIYKNGICSDCYRDRYDED
jgi:hypothetical protein